MDRRENNKIKKTTDIINLRKLVAAYLQKRKYSNSIIIPETVNKDSVFSDAVLNSRLSRLSSIHFREINGCLTLLTEYTYIFDKFLNWLAYQTENGLHGDLELLAGPLFCLFYVEIRNSDEEEEHNGIMACNAFCEHNIDKFDLSKCSDRIKQVINYIYEAYVESVTTGTEVDEFDFDDLKANKILIDISGDSLKLFKKFVLHDANDIKAHGLLLQNMQLYFEFHSLNNSKKVICEEDIPEEINVNKFDSQFWLLKPEEIEFFHNCKEIKQEVKQEIKQEVEEVLTDLYQKPPEESLMDKLITKIETVTYRVGEVPDNVFNVKLFNNKLNVSCGILKGNAGLVAFSEYNILKVMPIQELSEPYFENPAAEDDDEEIHYVKFFHHTKQIYCVVLSTDNRIICTGSADRTICIYDLIKLKLIKRLLGHSGPIYCLAISKDGKYLASGSQDGTARLWSLKSGRLLRIFSAHRSVITTLDFHPNGLYLVTGSFDKNIRLWGLHDAKTVRLLMGSERAVYSVKFSPDGQYLASASDDQKVKIWNLITAKVGLEFKHEEPTIFDLVWGVNSNYICAATVSNAVLIWKVNLIDPNRPCPYLKHCVDGQLICIDFSLETVLCLSVPPSSPFDDVL